MTDPVSLYGNSLPMQSFAPGPYLVNGAECVSDVVQGLAGNERCLHEWVTGTEIAGCTPCAPRTLHSGLPGHDHSGGVFGQPMQVSLASMCFGRPDDSISANVALGRAPRNRVTATTTTAGLLNNNIKLLWIPGGVCYQTLQLLVHCYSTATVDVKASWECGSWSLSQTQRLSISEGILTYTTKVLTQPGKRQRIHLVIEAVYVAAQADVSLLGIYLGQTATAP